MGKDMHLLVDTVFIGFYVNLSPFIQSYYRKISFANTCKYSKRKWVWEEGEKDGRKGVKKEKGG